MLLQVLFLISLIFSSFVFWWAVISFLASCRHCSWMLIPIKLCILVCFPSKQLHGKKKKQSEWNQWWEHDKEILHEQAVKICRAGHLNQVVNVQPSIAVNCTRTFHDCIIASPSHVCDSNKKCKMVVMKEPFSISIAPGILSIGIKILVNAVGCVASTEEELFLVLAEGKLFQLLPHGIDRFSLLEIMERFEFKIPTKNRH